MSVENIVTIITGVIETGAIGFLTLYIINGLKTKINTLQATISQQGKTIEVMEKRIIETEKVGGIYKSLIENMPKDIDNYRAFISKTKDSTIIELKEENETIKEKLKKAEETIEASKNPKSEIEKYLKILKKLMMQYEQRIGGDSYLSLKDICEFNKLQIENSVKYIVETQTLEEFINKLGFDVEINDDERIVNEILKEFYIHKENIPVRAQWGIDGHYILYKNKMVINSSFLSKLKDEYSIVKS